MVLSTLAIPRASSLQAIGSACGFTSMGISHGSGTIGDTLLWSPARMTNSSGVRHTVGCPPINTSMSSSLALGPGAGS